MSFYQFNKGLAFTVANCTAIVAYKSDTLPYIYQRRSQNAHNRMTYEEILEEAALTTEHFQYANTRFARKEILHSIQDFAIIELFDCGACNEVENTGSAMYRHTCGKDDNLPL